MPHDREKSDWEMQGPFTGRGPRRDQASQERILDEVCERLTRHSQIDASDIEVSLDGDELVLSGTVSSQSEKSMAEEVAAAIPGISTVRSDLQVSQAEHRPEARRESGLPGGGQGRQDRVEGSRVYPASGPLPPGDAEVRTMMEWGQGERGAEGYHDHGESELHVPKEKDTKKE